jgi:16S rRNA (guanine(527)-N(7))-methyltransferase RsmG
MSDSAVNPSSTIPKALAGMASQFELTEQQTAQFNQYLSLLLKANQDFNLTTIIDPLDAIEYHFKDSLAVGKFISFSSLKGVMDVGTGGGFPGIPLKIKYPAVPFFLLEVTQKKITFLQQVIQALSLKEIEVVPLDWRTFLRKAELPIELFVARASLQPSELLRAFAPSSRYKDAELIYWASREWEPTADVRPFIQKVEEYTVGKRLRKLVFLKK